MKRVKNKCRGKFYGIGIGPGDPGLLTLKAKEIIMKADVVFVPKARIKSQSLAKSIVEQAILEPINFEELIFPMSRDEKVLESHWEASAKRILVEIDQGKTVAFVTLGDPSIYSTYAYLMTTLKKQRPELLTETVPGISIINAAPALLDIPLVSGKERLAVLPLPDKINDLDDILTHFDTLVLLKIGDRLPVLKTYIKKRDIAEDIYFISRAGTKEQRIASGFDQLTDGSSGYLSTVIIKVPKEKP